MRLMFISDIHGIKTNLPKIKERFEKLNCDWQIQSNNKGR